MQDPRSELLPPPSSPTISSVSSSDLDSQSTGSFFHDRSITLGTLMGLSFPAITFRASSQRQVSPAASCVVRRQKKRGSSASSERRHRRRKWWRLCRDYDGSPTADGRPSSLGDFLEVERRCGAEAFYGGVAEQERRGGRVLFEEGRVLPPAADAGEEASVSSGLCRCPVYLSGICSHLGGG